MNRSNLRGFGVGLPDDQLAQALVALVMLAEERGVSWRPMTVDSVVQQLKDIGGSDICRVSSYWLPIRNDIAYDTAPVLAEGWRRFVGGQKPHLRLEVSGLGDLFPENAAWLARQAQHPAVHAASVYLRVDSPAYPVAWEWPLRLGVLGMKAPTTREASLIKALEQVKYEHLWTMVDMEQPGAECELLLLPGNLRSGLTDVLEAQQRPRADCVLVLNANEISTPRRLALAAALRSEAMTAGVALMHSGADVSALVTEVLILLSHNAPLDLALTKAAGKNGLPLPELLFSAELAAYSSVRLTAARVVHQFSPKRTNLMLNRSATDLGASLLESAAGEEGLELGASKLSDQQLEGSVLPGLETLETMVGSRPWEFEHAETSELVRIREDITRTTGQSHHTPRLRAVAPPQPVEGNDERQVLAQVTENGAGEPTKFLKVESGYRVQVKIASPMTGFSAAGIPFPEKQLPPSAVGHMLDLSFIPLVPDADGRRSALQQQPIFLPPVGESTEAAFVFFTHGITGTFQSRVLVSFENRILQALRLEGVLNATDVQQPAPYSFTVENIVYPGFLNLAYQAPFDAAIVVNESPRGRRDLAALTGSSIAFVEPEGIVEMAGLLQERLTDETAFRDIESDFGDDRMTSLLYGLMQHGRLLYDELSSQIAALDTDAGRIQLVEARPGAYFPAEFLYPLEVPPTKPPLCPHALAALKGETSHQRCAHRDDPEHMCPMRFWGFRKQIERQLPGDAVVGREQAMSLGMPTPLHGKLGSFNTVQVARSEKVDPPDYDLPKGLLKVLNASFQMVGKPANWKEWKAGVQENKPGCLLLLAHTTQDKDGLLPALEIYKDLLPLASLEASYVKGAESSPPMVFLLTCEAVDRERGFLTFVERFRRKHAALVVGTLSTISARRAAHFLSVALPILKDPKNKGRTFGEVFLEVKCTCLAKGDGFALSLVAYGDTGWQL